MERRKQSKSSSLRPTFSVSADERTRVIGYARVSTDEQAAGMQVQRDAIMAQCQRENLALTGLECDEGLSGGRFDRPALHRCLDHLAKGYADVLMVSKLDRLSRSLRDFAEIVDLASRQGWRLVIIDANVDTTSPSGALLVNVLAAFAQFERMMISQRTKDALAVKKAQGVRLGRPLGPEAAAGERVRAMRAQGMTWAAIAARLNEEETPTPSGAGRWEAKMAHRLAIPKKLSENV